MSYDILSSIPLYQIQDANQKTNYVYKCSSEDTGMFVWWPLTDQSFSDWNCADFSYLFIPNFIEDTSELDDLQARKKWSPRLWKNTPPLCQIVCMASVRFRSHFLDFFALSMVLGPHPGTAVGSPHPIVLLKSAIFLMVQSPCWMISSHFSVVESCQIPILRAFPNPWLYSFVPSRMSVLVKFPFLKYPLVK